MGDMSDAQRKAARKALGSFIDVKVTLERDGEITKLIPYRGDVSGTPVEILNEATPPAQVEREMLISCNALMGLG